MAGRRRLHALGFPEINAAGQFTHHQYVNALDDLTLEGRGIGQFRIQFGRPKIRKQPELFPQSQQCPFRPPLIVEAFPFRSAHRPQQDRVTGFGQLKRVVRERPSRVVNGLTADRGVNKLKCMPTTFSDRFQHRHGRRHDLRANAVTCQYCDLFLHNFSFTFTFTLTPGSSPGQALSHLGRGRLSGRLLLIAYSR